MPLKNYLSSLDSNNAKVRGLVALVNRVNQGTKLIDGIGTQAHLEANGAGGVQAALQAMAATGLDVAITYVYLFRFSRTILIVSVGIVSSISRELLRTTIPL